MKWLLFNRVKSVRSENHSQNEWKSFRSEWKSLQKRVKITSKEWISLFGEVHRGTARKPFHSFTLREYVFFVFCFCFWCLKKRDMKFKNLYTSTFWPSDQNFNVSKTVLLMTCLRGLIYLYIMVIAQSWGAHAVAMEVLWKKNQRSYHALEYLHRVFISKTFAQYRYTPIPTPCRA